MSVLNFNFMCRLQISPWKNCVWGLETN